MKKSIIISVCYFVLFTCIITCFLLIHPYSTTLEAATFDQVDTLQDLRLTTEDLSTQLTHIKENMASYEKTLSEIDKRLTAIDDRQEELTTLLVDYYINQLKDPTYTDIYNEEYTYYIAAESLGQIGKPAIPKLIEKLSTEDDYERALTLYALLLASQADNVKAFAGNDYIQTYLDFDSRNHPELIKIAKAWWEKYSSYF
ncbi:MAG: hypothetical protein H9872_08830 [Candidatus Cellulosilyticum pullistercoris]|uniref:HEAT repeat domain-containing protein n=1 Tax=Candidatus Cellulosilyticum pullistercoris TaxID=2838521 RepID=A0A9E2NLX1_9FIRM|nr:hypothetical protein [Candidatus Cellulosilyticum pullistercoris]